VLLTRAPLYSGRSPFTFDLHVLGTPPAFVLSQDQTLHLEPQAAQAASSRRAVTVSRPALIVENFLPCRSISRRSTTAFFKRAVTVPITETLVNLFLQSHSPSGPRRRRSVRRGGLIADLRVRSQELFGAEIVFFRRAAPDAGFGTLTPLVHGAKQLRLSFPSAQALVCGCMGTPSCRFAPI
jgi:hypothetical protein